MRTRKDVVKELETIKLHKAMSAPIATIQKDPALAMVQIDLQSKVFALEWVLGDTDIDTKALYGETWVT